MLRVQELLDTHAHSGSGNVGFEASEMDRFLLLMSVLSFDQHEMVVD